MSERVAALSAGARHVVYGLSAGGSENWVLQRWTAPSRLAIEGGSAGGITVGRALTERPDLFAAVISNLGLSNALRAEFSQNGPPNIDAQ